MNPVHWSIFKTNCRRFFSSKTTYPIYIFSVFWLISYTLAIQGASDRPVEFILIFTVVFALILSDYFWLFGWSLGEVDPITSMHNDKNRKDRFFIKFMSTLPLTRGTHFLIQALLYTLLCVAICLFSFLLQILFPIARENIGLILFFHLLVFAVLVLVGAIQTLTALPYAFRGEVNSYRHPIVLRSYLFGLFFMGAVAIVGNSNSIIDPSTIYGLGDIFLNNPFLVLCIFLISIFVFYCGHIKFINQEIK